LGLGICGLGGERGQVGFGAATGYEEHGGGSENRGQDKKELLHGSSRLCAPVLRKQQNDRSISRFHSHLRAKRDLIALILRPFDVLGGAKLMTNGRGARDSAKRESFSNLARRGENLGVFPNVGLG
jgi:hypothetical protein